MSKQLVVYHGNCMDGFASAFVMSFVVKPDAEFFPAVYKGAIPDVYGKDVFILDFSFPRDVLVSMAKQANTIVLLDHHATAEKELTGLDLPNLRIVFDMEKSGAQLTLDYVKRMYTVEAWPQLDQLVNYVGDRDLWKFALPNSKEYNAAISTFDLTFEAWNGMLKIPFEQMVTIGKAITRLTEKSVKEKATKARLCNVRIPNTNISYQVPVLNTTSLVSEIIGELAIGFPFAMGFFITNENKVVFSLRSTQDIGADVGSIAKTFGGGGHKHAAGFTTSIGDLRIILGDYLEIN